MNETTGNGTTGGDGQAAPGGAPPGLMVNLQYVKDLSFEVPGAPDIFVQMKQQPEVAINLDVNARQVAQGSFEVVLSIRYRGPIEAPIAEGQPVAFLRVDIPGQIPHEVPLVAAEPVARANVLERLRNGIVGLLT